MKSNAKTRVLRAEISNVFKNCNADINDSLNSELVVLQVKEKHEEFEKIVCQRCQKEHLAMDFPLDSPTIFCICDLNHSTDHCPSIPRMKETYPKSSQSCSQLIVTVMETAAYMYGLKLYPSISLLSYSIIKYSRGLH